MHSYLVTNLPPTHAGDLYSHFARFGSLRDIHIDPVSRRAIISYVEAPSRDIVEDGDIVDKVGPDIVIRRVDETERAMIEKEMNAAKRTTKNKGNEKEAGNDGNGYREGSSDIVFDCASCAFGTMVGERTVFVSDEIHVHQSLSSHGNEEKSPRNMVLKFLPRRKVVSIVFEFSFDDPFRVESHFNSITSPFYISRQTQSIEFTLNLPLKLYRGRNANVKSYGRYTYRSSKKAVWERVTGLPGDLGNVVFGNVDVIKVTLDPETLKKWDFDKKLGVLEKLNLGREYMTQPLNNLEYITHLEEEFVDLWKSDVQLAFGVRYKVLTLVSHRLMPCYLVNNSFIEALRNSSEKIASLALDYMLAAAKKIYNPLDALTYACQHVSKLSSSISNPENCDSVRKVVITPTRTLCFANSMELGNRVLRHFQQHHDRFLRITFAEETLSKTVDGTKIGRDILARIRSVLDDGLEIGGIRFRFLAFSSSQLREHSAWFFADTDDGETTADSIRCWMGEFGHIKVVAKYAARLGQCFSSSIPIGVTREMVAEVPDINANGFCFSDGIGKISFKLASEIAASLGKEIVPTAFQIRMGGYKGVVSVDLSIQDSDPQIQFRPSMKKFESKHLTALEVIRTSSYAPAFLNHQIITLLSSMNIKTRSFIQLQKAYEKQLETAVAGDYSSLHSFCTENNLFRIVRSMLAAGLTPTTEPFLENVLKLLQSVKLSEVKTKARILVPKGVQLIGVLDETGTLEYGQMFVQFTDPKDPTGRTRRIVKGQGLLAKMPAVHPGDVRVLQCVDDPKLRHYVDVIVFPQKGKRPHPNEASGSDLDGDIYFVTWDSSLIPVLQNYRPLDYNPPPPLEVADKVTINDIKQFFMNYIQNDNLGLIATAHKIHADLSEKGVLSETCQEIAKLHSTAVDFPKTGIPALFDNQLYGITEYPDFMGKTHLPMYQSKKALGKLYRSVSVKDFVPTYALTLNKSLIVDGNEFYLDEARIAKAAYDFDISQIMAEHDIKTEFEVISQLLTSFNKGNSSREYDLKEMLGNIMAKVVDKYKTRFWTDMGNYNEEKQGWEPFDRDAVLKKASAWYRATYDVPESDSKSERLFSFPWMTVWNVLLELLPGQSTVSSQIIFPGANVMRKAAKKPDLSALLRNREKNNKESVPYAGLEVLEFE